ncbi:MAG: helix-turn-helix domain-containing protein [Oscillospiraceae bacterium]
MENSFRISHNRDNNAEPVYFHSHDFYEIYFFVDGSVKYYIENESYELAKGDVIVIPPGKLHRPVFGENVPYERYVLWIYGSYAARSERIGVFLDEIDHLTAEKNTRLSSFEVEPLRELTGLFDKLSDSFEAGDKTAFYTAESCMVLILGEIADKLKSMDRVGEEQGGLIRQVIGYINRHVADSPSLEELSTRFFVSKYYLSHKFREYTKTTVHQYILMKKVNLAKELLEKGFPPKEVCESCGFSSYSNFYKVFKAQTGVSPKAHGR